MNFDLAASVAVLERTPQTFRAMLGGLSPVWTDATESENQKVDRFNLGLAFMF